MELEKVEHAELQLYAVKFVMTSESWPGLVDFIPVIRPLRFVKM
jgi:hypothetical protein